MIIGQAYGVEPICKVLPIAPSTYHAQIAQRIEVSKRSARAQRDAELKIEVRRVFVENFGVYGVRTWAAWLCICSMRVSHFGSVTPCQLGFRRHRAKATLRTGPPQASTCPTFPTAQTRSK
jgi:hypothetical protein